MERSLETSSGVVFALSLSKKRGVPKINVEEAELVEAFGLAGDAHGGPGLRQVSLLALESIRKMCGRGFEVRPGLLAENITTARVDLSKLRTGDRVAIGESLLEITQLGKECKKPCAIFHKVGDCVMPREGIFARVLRGGRIRKGDPFILERTWRTCPRDT